MNNKKYANVIFAKILLKNIVLSYFTTFIKDK